ncbi:ABC transporter ATP-binding protein [Christensenellaceae bacterium]|nr:ABC transporter ATP-binding protein [Christensenellaceae bacterium]BDF59994.1 ABC transporter ATP-binding protein [Christensenellaceae bacterium]
MNETLLQVERLTIKLKNQNQELVRDISFSLEEAGTITLLGQSGSGKTLTCRAILGLLNRSAFQVGGEILFEEKSLLQLKEKERALYYGSRIAFVPQNPMTALDPSRKIGVQMAEFLRLHQELSKKEVLSLCEQAMVRAGLTDTKRILNSRPYQLSGGMLQRVLIALAIAGKARLVIADEPTTALDAIHRDRAVEQLLKLREQGCAILIVTHDFDVARHMGGHVLIMKEGRMVERGSAKEVLQNPKAGYTKELIEAIHLGWG